MGKGETTSLTTVPPFGKQKKSFQKPTQCVFKTRKKKKEDSLKNSARPGPSRAFHHSSVSKESVCNAGGLGLIPGFGRFPGEGNGNPLQYSCLENPLDRRALQATVHRVLRVGHDLVTKPPESNKCGAIYSYKQRGFNPWVGKIPWSRARQPTPVFSPGESYRQWSLAGYSP